MLIKFIKLKSWNRSSISAWSLRPFPLHFTIYIFFMPPPPTAETVAASSIAIPDEIISLKNPKWAGVSRGYTWDEIKLVVAAQRYELLGRHTKDEATYVEFMKRMRAQYGTTIEFMAKSKLVDFLADPAANFHLIPSDFPYAIPEGAAHYILWSKPKLQSLAREPEIPLVREIIVDKFNEIYGGPDNYEWVWFVNPPHLQTIPEVSHGHAIAVKKSTL